MVERTVEVSRIDPGFTGETALVETSGHISRWYALYLRSRYEKVAHAELLEKGIESFLPMIEEVRVWSDRKKRVQMPLFRSYLFVRTDLHDRVSILQTDGVVHFVGIRSVPSPIPDDQIAWIKIVIAQPQRVKREPNLATGKRVRVVAGPFTGVEGVITKVRGNARLVINLDAIAQAISVDVEPGFVKTVERLVTETSKVSSQ